MFNNSSNSSRAMEIFNSGVGADCVIEVVQDGQQDKKEFNVHKYVLIFHSDVFMAMFSHENTKEARESRIQITDSTPTAVRQMLIYLYTGELSTEYAIETDAGPLMHIANKYQIKALAKLIEQRLVNSLSLTNVVDRVELADLYQIKALYSSCGQLIRRNLQMVKKEAKWMELKKKAPELAFAMLEDVDEFRDGNNFLPAGKFSMDGFKRVYSNEDTATKAIPYFWENFDPEHYSIWYSEYKYPEELKLAYMSCNLIGGMFQRLEKLKKTAFASVCLFGTDNNSTISGIWVWRGKELAFPLSPDWQVDYESYDWKKLDPANEATKKKVKEYFMWEGEFDGKKFNQGKIFK